MANKKGIDTNTVILIIVVVLLIALVWGVFFKAPVEKVAGEGELGQAAPGGDSPEEPKVCQKYLDASKAANEKADAAKKAVEVQKALCEDIKEKKEEGWEGKLFDCQLKLLDLLKEQFDAVEAALRANDLSFACGEGYKECADFKD